MTGEAVGVISVVAVLAEQLPYKLQGVVCKQEYASNMNLRGMLHGVGDVN